MAEHDSFIADCKVKTRQILHATANQRIKSSSSKSIKKTSSPFERTTKKNNPMKSLKAATSHNSRRPIERDFYKMRTASTRKPKCPTKDNETPPLESSVLRKKYRCDEKIMLDKEKRALRLQAKFEDLQKRHQDADDEGSSSSDSTSDDDENNSSHVIHDLVERMIESENQISLQRANDLASSSVYTPSVKQMWDEFEQTEVGEAARRSIDGGEVDMKTQTTEEDTTSDLLFATAKISGNVTNTSKITPGHKPLGRVGMWRLNSPIDEVHSDSSLFHWPSPSEIRYPEHLDTSQASSYFYSKPVGSDGETCVTVLNSFSFKSPILAPHCYATSQGFVVPPFSQHECVNGPIPHITFPGTSLMKAKVDSRLDSLLRQPIVVVDPAATIKDHMHASTSTNSLDEFDENGFRRMTYADAIEYDDTISTRSFGISSAIPNKPKVSSLITHKSTECCVEYLSRERTAADYHYILESDGEGTHSEPYLFVSHMSAYHLRNVSKMSITEQNRRVLEAEEAETRRLNELSSTLRLEGAEELAKQRFAERVGKIKDSVKPETKHVQSKQTHTQTQAVAVGESFSMSPNALHLTLESQPRREQRPIEDTKTRDIHNPIGLRNVVIGSNEPKLIKLDDNRKLATSRATPKSYESQFATKTKSLFIRDLTTERLKLSKTRSIQKKTEHSILSEIQHQSLDEILQVPVSATSAVATSIEEDQRRIDTMDPVTRAIMAVKNHNLAALEEVLDTEGDLDIDTRDQHGNTLFILACQQNSKKLAKFLLRRGSYINAQNHAGNTALHYLNEYNHTSLAEWLTRKGADDTLKNVEGLTAYEGVIFNI